jgi:hypothetical protein
VQTETARNLKRKLILKLPELETASSPGQADDYDSDQIYIAQVKTKTRNVQENLSQRQSHNCSRGRPIAVSLALIQVLLKISCF